MKMIYFKYNGTCLTCSRTIYKGDRAWWDSKTDITAHAGECKTTLSSKYARWMKVK